MMGKSPAIDPSPPSHRGAVPVLTFATAGLAGLVLVLGATATHGIGLPSDGVYYLSTADSLAAREGLRSFDGSPFVSWPPGFPAAIAIGSLGPGDVFASARTVNAFVFGAIVALAGWWLYRHLASTSLAVIGTGMILSAGPLFATSTSARSEPLFALFLVLSGFALERHLARLDWTSLITAAGLTGAACLTRYLGVAVILSGVALILGGASGKPTARIVSAFAYALLSALPLCAWLAWTYAVSSTIGGERPPSPYSLGHNATVALDVITGWFLPTGLPLAFRTIIALVASVVVVLPWLSRGRREIAEAWRVLPTGGGVMGTLAVLIAAYLVVTASLTAIDPLDDRLFSPVWVPLVLCGFTVLDVAVTSGRRENGRWEWLRYAVPAILAFALIIPTLSRADEVRAAREEGAEGYTTEGWQKSSLFEYLRQHPAELRLYSNAPDVVFAATGRPAQWTPAQHAYNSIEEYSTEIQHAQVETICRSLLDNGTAHFIWLAAWDAMPEMGMMPLDALRVAFGGNVGWETVASGTDWAVFAWAPVSGHCG